MAPQIFWAIQRLSKAATALLTVALTLSPTRLYAETVRQDATNGLTLEQALTQAVQKNPGLSAAKRDIGAARFSVGSARSLTGPSAFFVPGITSLSGTGEELLIQQPLEVNGVRSARTGVAAAQLRTVEAQAAGTLRTLVFDTTTAYYELARARELQGVAREVLKTAEEIDRITRRQVELGSRPGIELAQTGVEVDRMRQQVTLADSQEEVARAALNTLLGNAPAAAVGALSPVQGGSTLVAPEGDAARAGNEEAIIRAALDARPETAGVVAARSIYENQARAARAEGRPDLAPQFRAGSVIRGFSDYGIGVAVSLPLIDYGARSGRIRQAEASARAQDDRLRQTEQRIRQEVTQALARERAARASVTAYQGGLLDKAKRLLDASRIGFEAGTTSIVALLEAQRTYRVVQTESTNALVALALARAELQRATGQLPTALRAQDMTGTTK